MELNLMEVVSTWNSILQRRLASSLKQFINRLNAERKEDELVTRATSARTLLLQDNEKFSKPNGGFEKPIIFTEHRDTLD